MKEGYICFYLKKTTTQEQCVAEQEKVQEVNVFNLYLSRTVFSECLNKCVMYVAVSQHTVLLKSL